MADKEEVIFQEGVPESPSQIYQLLMQAYSEQRRSVVKFFVDEVDCMSGGNFPDSFKLIEAESLSHDEITLRISIQLLNQMSQLAEHLSAYQANILSNAWSDVIKQMDDFISKIQPFADLIDNVLPYAESYSPPWKNSFENIAKEQAKILEAVLFSFESSNPAGLSDHLQIEFLPLLERTKSLFAKEIIPFLKNASEDTYEEDTP